MLGSPQSIFSFAYIFSPIDIKRKDSSSSSTFLPGFCLIFSLRSAASFSFLLVWFRLSWTKHNFGLELFFRSYYVSLFYGIFRISSLSRQINQNKQISRGPLNRDFSTYCTNIISAFFGEQNLLASRFQ